MSATGIRAKAHLITITSNSNDLGIVCGPSYYIERSDVSQTFPLLPVQNSGYSKTVMNWVITTSSTATIDSNGILTIPAGCSGDIQIEAQFFPREVILDGLTSSTVGSTITSIEVVDSL